MRKIVILKRDTDVPLAVSEVAKTPTGFEVEKREITAIPSRSFKGRKTGQINIRVNPEVLKQIKKQARELGLPYQTYLTIVFHKLASGSLRIVI